MIASVPPSGTVTLLVAAGAGDPSAAAPERHLPGYVAAAGAAEPAAAAQAGLAVAGPAPAGTAPAGPAQVEPAQPVFTRYWLHAKGPAPAGNLPVAVHVSPGRAAIPVDGAVSLRVTVSAGRFPVTGTVELEVPDGLAAEVAGRSVARGGRDGLRYDLPSGGYAAWKVTVRPASGASSPAVTSAGATSGATPPGRYFLAARISDPAGQVLEDVATVAVGEVPVPPLDTPLGELLPLLEADERTTAAELEVTLPGDDITLAPGERGELVVRLINRTRSQIRGEAQLLSPFGTWRAITPWTQGFMADPGAEVTARYQVVAPDAGASARPGAQWWALVKVCYFGRVRYTGVIRVSIAA